MTIPFTYRDEYGRWRQMQIQDPNAPPPAPKPPDYLAGLDIGQRDDWTALAIVRKDVGGADVGGAARPEQSLTLVALERVRRIPYPEIARLVADTLAELGTYTLLVDTTGVGRPVTDQLKELGIRHMRVSIHGGSSIARLDDDTLSVPKRDLIAALVVGFESGRLRIARGLKHTGTLEREAAAFQMKLSASGRDSYSARTGEHDDLLLAVSLPIWHAGRPQRAVYVY